VLTLALFQAERLALRHPKLGHPKLVMPLTQPG